MKSRVRALVGHPVFLLLAFGIILLFTGFYQQYSNDLWKALYSGRYVSLFRQFPHHSTFTFSPVEAVQPRNAYNWLGNLILLGLYRGGGIPVLLVFRLVILLFAVGLTFSIIGDVHPLVVFALVAYAFGIKQKLLLRTAIFVVPCLSLMLWLWIQYDLTGTPAVLWAVPPLMVFWSNVHGSYLVGVGLLGLMVLGELADGDLMKEPREKMGKARLILMLVLVVLGVTFVKPFPDYSLSQRFRGLIERTPGLVGRTVLEDQPSDRSDPSVNSNNRGSRTDKSSDRAVRPSESTNGSRLRTLKQFLQGLFFEEQSWRSGEFGFPLTSYSFLFVSVVLVLFPAALALFAVRPSTFRFVQFLPVAGSLVLALGYLRTVAYFPLVAVPVGFWKVRRGDFSGESPGAFAGAVARVGVILLALNMVFHVYRGRLGRFFGVAEHRFRVGTTVRFSQSMPPFILNRYPDERMFTAYNLSSYLVWRWWPYKKVFIDTKGSAYRDDFFAEYGRSSPEALAERHDLSYMLFSLGNPRALGVFVPGTKWALGAFDEGMVLFERVSEPHYRDPMVALLLSPESVRNLPGHVRPGLRSLITYFYRNQNRSREFR